MRHLVPSFLLAQMAEDMTQGTFNAVVLFVDTSGFTPLTGQLSAQGRDGAEVLAEILLAVFEPLVATVYAYGGFIAGFAGDAIKAVFRGDDASIYLAALAAAEAIRTHMAANPSHVTRYGTFDFSVRMSIADGLVQWTIWSNAQQIAAQTSSFTFAGPALDQAIQGEDYADGGELVVSNNVFVALQHLHPDIFTDRLMAGGAASYIRVLCNKAHLPTAAINPENTPANDNEPMLAHAARFYPQSLLDMRMQGEFRSVYTLFLNVASLPQPSAEDDFLPLFFHLLEQYGGYLCRVGRIGANDPGGTFLLFWGAPTSHENDLTRVLGFILALQHGIAQPLRAGITHAVVYAGFIGSALREEYTCYGSSVNQAARQMVVADWGEILVDATIAERAATDFLVSMARQYKLKGLATERPLFQLVGRRTQQQVTIYDTYFVGRQQEMAQLQNAINPIFTGRFAGITLVYGEAGIGKSRLVHEAAQRLTAADAQLSVQLLRGQTDEILRESLNPLRYILRHYFDQSPTADYATNYAQLMGKIDTLIDKTTDAMLVQALDHGRSFLAALVNIEWPDSLYAQLEPQLRFDNTLAALRTLIFAECRQQPVLLLLEDTQWLDEDSLTFLRQLIESAEPYPLAIVATARLSEEPESAWSLWDEEATPTIPYHELTLTALSTNDITAMMAQQLGGPISASLRDLLLHRADGNPFFIEQLLHYLMEQQALTQTADGWQLVTTTATQLDLPDIDKSERELPDTIESVLIARLDQLTQTVKQVVQTAAILGREFRVTILSEMLRGELALVEKVRLAENAAIWAALSELDYLFRHALLRDAAYAMQLKTHRSRLHKVAAEAIETLHAGQLAPYYADLTYHYHHAGLVEKECTFAALAGKQAAAQFANRSALTYLQRALTLTAPADHATRYHLLQQCERVHKLLGDTTEQLADLEAMQQLADTIASPAQQAEVALLYAEYYTSISDYATATDAVTRAIALAERVDDLALQCEGYQRWGRALWPQAKYRESQQAGEQALTLARQAALPEQEANALVVLGIALWFLSDYAAAQARLEASLPLFAAIGKPFAQKAALVNLAIVAQIVGDDHKALTYFDQAVMLAREMGARQDEAAILAMMGASHHKVGNYELALEMLQMVRPVFTAVHDRFGQIVAATNLGLVYMELGDYSAARDALTDALQLAQLISSRAQESGIRVALGQIDLAEGQWTQAHTQAETALQIAQEIGFQDGIAKALLLRGHSSLALGQATAAHADLVEALTIRRTLNQPLYAQEILAGLAHTATVRADWSGALVYIEEILGDLDVPHFESIPNRFQIYLTCYQVLVHMQDQRAGTLLTAAFQQLQTRAAKIQNHTIRAAYLNDVESHRAIVAAWQADKE